MAPPPASLTVRLIQLRSNVLDSPFPAGPWLSIARRAGVVTAWLIVALATGELTAGIGAAFGALQMGLMEAAVPGRKLVQLVAVNVVALTAMAFAASALGGTWWTVALLAAVALVQGATVASGVITSNTAIGVLSVGVLFAALPRPVGSAAIGAGWVLAGVASQAAIWLALRRPERAMTVRRALANDVRLLRRMLDKAPETRAMTEAAGQTEHLGSLIGGSGLSAQPADSARSVRDAIDEVRRSLISWLIVREPDFAQRQAVRQWLTAVKRSLDDWPVGNTAMPAPPPIQPGSGDPWTCDRRLAADLANLGDATASLTMKSATPAARTAAAGNGGKSELDNIRASLLPSSPAFLHGARMAVGIGIAQAITLVIGISHSFWIPLTVVFVLKPDWSFTLVKSVGRIAGNSAAALFVPLALEVAGGRAWASAAVAAILAVVMYRYFTGNYMLACFGLAGTVLTLDQVLAPDEGIYLLRIGMTLLGAALAVAVAYAMPTWRSVQAEGLTVRLAANLRTWSEQIEGGGPVGRSAGNAVRLDLRALRPVYEATAVEPRPVCDPIALGTVVESGERADALLLALGAYPRTDQSLRSEREAFEVADVRARLGDAMASLDRARAHLAR